MKGMHLNVECFAAAPPDRGVDAHASASRQHRMLHLFDSFEGMPETVQGVDRLKRGDLSGTSVTRVEGLLKAFPLQKCILDLFPGNICWIKGGESVLGTHRRRHLPKRA